MRLFKGPAPRRETGKSNVETERKIADLRKRGKLLDPVEDIEEAFELADQAREIMAKALVEE